MGQKSDLISELECFRDLVDKHHQTTSNTVYTSIYDFMLKEGKMYESQELTDTEQYTVSKAIANLPFNPKQRECYKNAQSLFLSDNSNQIKYVEGNCRIKSLPFSFPHAFNEINGKVIDLTWTIRLEDKTLRHNIGYFNGFEYFGVIFSKRQIMQRQSDTEEYASLIEMNRELLTKKHSL